MANPWTLEQIDQLEKSGKLSSETANAARMKVQPAVPLSTDQQSSVANYIKSDPVKQMADQQQKAATNDNFVRSFNGQGDFRDSGRQSEGLGESVDSALGVPARVLANEIVKNGPSLGAVTDALVSVGNDPKYAPTGHEIAVNAGVSEKPFAKFKGSTLATMATYLPGIGHLVAAAKNFLPKEIADREFEPSPADVVGTGLDFGLQVPVGTIAKVGGAAGKFAGVTGRLEKVAKVADEYNATKGLPRIEAPGPVKVDVEKAKRIAQEYEAMAHDPENPAVKKAYDALKEETLAQFQAIKQSGLKVSKIKPGMDNPYKSSADLISDIRDNNHMWFYPTESGFGNGATANHPLLSSTNEVVDGEKLLSNDIFRIVHDYFGHGKEEYKFGAKGEEGAWREHKKMYSPEAMKALTTETRGQNSWVNYGPNGEFNRANPEKTIYAEQKAGLLPEWTHLSAKTGVAKIDDMNTLANTQQAQKLLDKVNTAEKAAALQGADKEKYLAALDHVYGPREQRATDMGFSDKTWYHGTNEEFDKFNPAMGREGWEAFVTDNKTAAKRFAKRHMTDMEPMVRELKLRGNTKDPFIPLKEIGVIKKDVQGVSRYNEGVNAGQKVDPTNNWVGVETKGVRDAFKEKGIDNAYITENDFARKGAAYKNVAVGDASYLRDVDANFDPRFKDSPLLLAGKSGVAGDAEDLATISRAEQSKKVSKAGTLAQEGYTFGRKYTGDGVEVVAKFRGKEVGKAVIGKDGAKVDVASLHQGKGIDEELVRFGKNVELNGKAGAANAEDLSTATRADSILSRIDTPEKAAALKGAEREEYFAALDEVYGPKEIRAAKLGFGSGDVEYHGTKHNEAIDSFRESGAKHGDVSKYGKGVYTTDSADKASDYSGAYGDERASGSVYPVRLKNKMKFEPHDQETAEKILAAEGITDPKRGMLRSGEQGQHLLEKNLGGKNFTDVLDKHGYRLTEDQYGPSISVSKPKDIRSVNAAFDPRFKDSANLLAGKAGAVPIFSFPASQDEEDHFLDQVLDHGDVESLDGYLNHILRKTRTSDGQ